MRIADMLVSEESKIRSHVILSDKLWNSLVGRTRMIDGPSHDEQIFTFLIACGYALAGHDGVISLYRQLTGDYELSVSKGTSIWIEALPLPPRLKEGNTNLDMAMGGIAERSSEQKTQHHPSTTMAIQYAGNGDPICFVEAKWKSDIDTKVTHDTARNQLARVIENALAFVEDPVPQSVYVTLLTPAVYRDDRPRSRLYWYKFNEYNDNPNTLRQDLKLCRLPMRALSHERLIERIDLLKLNWCTFEELWEQMPNSSISDGISELFGKSKIIVEPID